MSKFKRTIKNGNTSKLKTKVETSKNDNKINSDNKNVRPKIKPKKVESPNYESTSLDENTNNTKPADNVNETIQFINASRKEPTKIDDFKENHNNNHNEKVNYKGKIKSKVSNEKLNENVSKIKTSKNTESKPIENNGATIPLKNNKYKASKIKNIVPTKSLTNDDVGAFLKTTNKSDNTSQIKTKTSNTISAKVNNVDTKIKTSTKNNFKTVDNEPKSITKNLSANKIKTSTKKNESFNSNLKTDISPKNNLQNETKTNISSKLNTNKSKSIKLQDRNYNSTKGRIKTKSNASINTNSNIKSNNITNKFITNVKDSNITEKSNHIGFKAKAVSTVKSDNKKVINKTSNTIKDTSTTIAKSGKNLTINKALEDDSAINDTIKNIRDINESKNVVKNTFVKKQKVKPTKKISNETNNKIKSKTQKSIKNEEVKAKAKTKNKNLKKQSKNTENAKTSIKTISSSIKKLVEKTVTTKTGLAVAGMLLSVVISSATIASFTTIVGSISVSYPVADEDVITEIAEYLSELDAPVNEEIESYKSSDDYDDIVFDTNDNDTMYTNLHEMLVYIAILKENDISLDDKPLIKEIHDKSYNLYTQTETYIEDDEEKTRLIIHFYIYNFEEMLNILEFTEEQKEVARLMIENELSDLYSNIPNQVKPLSKKELEELLANAGTTNKTRLDIIETALTLNDYTTYQMGGKASGDVVKPTSLDCSGFVGWVYARSGVTNALQGGGTAYQWDKSVPIAKEDLQAGDLGFLQVPYTIKPEMYNHVGIYMGNGRWIECYSSHGVGITSGNSFNYYRTVPMNYE